MKTQCVGCGVDLEPACLYCGQPFPAATVTIDLTPRFIAGCALSGVRPERVAAAILAELFDPPEHLRPGYQGLWDAAILERL